MGIGVCSAQTMECCEFLLILSVVLLFSTPKVYELLEIFGKNISKHCKVERMVRRSSGASLNYYEL